MPEKKPAHTVKTTAKTAKPAPKEEARKPIPAVKQEAKPAKPVPVKEEPKKPVPAPVQKKAANTSDAYSGKWVIKTTDNGFAFDLYASNGEKMLGSGEYTSLSNAKKGIETYKKNIAAGNFAPVRTKTGDYILQLLNANGKLLALGADYKDMERYRNAIESTKRFAETAPVEITTDDE